MAEDSWVEQIEKRIQEFSREYRLVYAKSERELSASFEIGCLHLLTNDYGSRAKLEVQNLSEGGFRYLTTPAGNPNNFSWIRVTMAGCEFQIRQQVRVRSHLAADIAFTPDILVLKGSATVDSVAEKDFANGKKRFFTVHSEDVLAAHECKSLVPFPELLISFVGTLIAAHGWLDSTPIPKKGAPGTHLAPSLFVGGSTNALQRRMVQALEGIYPINIFTGLHDTELRLCVKSDLRYLDPKGGRSSQ
jgi:hypothetical protein